MKKPKFLWLVPIMVLTGVFCGCDAAIDGGDDNGENSTPSKPKPGEVEPESNGITLDPGKVWVEKGTTIPFRATVELGSETLNWTVLGSSTGDEAPKTAGMIYYLKVDEAEIKEFLTVRAALPDDPAIKGEAIVWILGNEGSVTTSGLAVRPQSIMLGPGDNRDFKAYTVTDSVVNSDEEKEVTWTVTGASAGTVFNGSTLTVGAGETARTFTVTATKEDMTGTAIVTVFGNEDDPMPVSGGIYLSPQRDVVKKGRATVFRAYSDPDNEITTGLTWTVFGAANTGTVVNNGTLTAADDETAERLTVRATTVDGSYGTAVVTVITSTTLNSVEEVSTRLDSTNDGTAASRPVALPLYINLSQDWTNLLTAISGAEKYVSLDLSECLMDGTEFDPASSNSTGKEYIVSLTLPDAATKVKAGSSSTYLAFQNFIAIKSIDGKNVTEIGNYAFSNLATLSSINFPLATKIGTYAFYQCRAIKSVDLPSATEIGTYAFYNCTGIEYAALPLATKIDNYAFYGCTGMSPVSITSATEINDYAFNGCKALVSLSLLEATTIGSSAFRDCSNLRTVTLPKATTIGISAFQGCSKLETVTFPNAAEIKEYAFRSCTKLASVSLPETLTTIGNNPFVSCTSLTSFSVDSSNDNFSVQSGSMLLNKAGTKLLSYPTATGAVTLASTITDIGNAAFYDCTTLTSVTANSVTIIGDYAFYGCSNLATVTRTKTASIGTYAFYGCSVLTSVGSQNIKSIGERAFYQCKKLTSVTLSASTISTHAFYQCYALTSVTASSVTSIGTYAFQGCTALTSATLDEAKTISASAFQGCTKLTTVTLTKAISLGTYAFQDCTKLVDLYLPSSPPTLNTSVFLYTKDTNGSTLTIHLPAGSYVSTYTAASAWNVTQNTVAEGNQTKYGNNHKAINIVVDDT